MSKDVPGVKLVVTDTNKSEMYDFKGNDITEKAAAEWLEYIPLHEQLLLAGNENESIENVLRRVKPDKLNNPAFMFHVCTFNEMWQASISLMNGKYWSNYGLTDGDDQSVFGGV